MAVAAIGSNFSVNTVTAGFHLHPVVTRLAAGRFAVVWESEATKAGELKSRIFHADGGPAGAEFLVNQPASRNATAEQTAHFAKQESYFKQLYLEVGQEVEQAMVHARGVVLDR